jgi:hypothetical protein
VLLLLTGLMFADTVGVQGFSDGQRELLDAESVTGHLLPAGSVFAFLAEQVAGLRASAPEPQVEVHPETAAARGIATSNNSR